jgi:hypothetical protein
MPGATAFFAPAQRVAEYRHGKKFISQLDLSVKSMHTCGDRHGI